MQWLWMFLFGAEILNYLIIIHKEDLNKQGSSLCKCPMFPQLSVVGLKLVAQLTYYRRNFKIYIVKSFSLLEVIFSNIST